MHHSINNNTIHVPATNKQPIFIKDSKDLNEWLNELINNVAEYRILIIPPKFTHKYINVNEEYSNKDFN